MNDDSFGKQQLSQESEDTHQKTKINQLKSFKNYVERQRGRLFDEQDAADLISRTDRLIESLTSGGSGSRILI